MASRTIATSVAVAAAPPDNLPELDAALDALRTRFPGVIFARYRDTVPVVGERVFLAPGAAIIGDVTLHDDVSVWYGCVLRGDVNRIEIGARSNIQDGTVIHLGDADPAIVGEDVVVGHRAVLHGCTVGDGCLIGIQATVLDGARIGKGSLVGAGAVVPAATEVPDHSLVLGAPAKVVRALAPSAETFHRGLAAKYVRLQTNYRQG